MPTLALNALFPLALVVLLSGCHKSLRESAEQKAIARHQLEVRQRKALQAAFRGPERARILNAARLLMQLEHNGRLPGPANNAEGSLVLDTLPALTPKGPYYWSMDFHVLLKDSPTPNYHYVVAQIHSNGDFQLQKAWRAGASDKVVETFPINPPPIRTNANIVFLGPANPGAERGLDHWYHGVLGGGFVSTDKDDPASSCSRFSIGITNATAFGTNHADLRSEMFSLGNTAKKHRPITLSFAYKLPDEVKPGDNIEVNFRFFGTNETFLGQKTILLGSSTSDSEMAQYKTMAVTGILAPGDAVKADLWVVANIAGPWTSGLAQFDDFSVTTTPGHSLAMIPIAIGAAALAGFGALLIWKTDRRRTTKAVGGFAEVTPAANKCAVLKPDPWNVDASTNKA